MTSYYPALTKNYIIIVQDLRRLDDTSKPVTGYDGEDYCTRYISIGLSIRF